MLGRPHSPTLDFPKHPPLIDKTNSHKRNFRSLEGFSDRPKDFQTNSRNFKAPIGISNHVNLFIEVTFSP